MVPSLKSWYPTVSCTRSAAGREWTFDCRGTATRNKRWTKRERSFAGACDYTASQPVSIETTNKNDNKLLCLELQLTKLTVIHTTKV